MDDHCFEFLHNSTVSFSNNPTINLTVASFINDVNYQLSLSIIIIIIIINYNENVFLTFCSQIIWLGNKSFMCFRPLYYRFMSQALGAR